jgi:prepilin-type N-terminal cleavage/methylation domain-containing protein
MQYQTQSGILQNMLTKVQSRRGGFTLVEIMIVVAIIALLASIAVPSFLRARKRSQATSTLETCRMVDAAKDQYAIENGKSPGVTPSAADLAPYVKNGTKLYNDLNVNSKAIDNLGNTIAINGIDVPPKVDPATRTSLDDVLGGVSSAAADTFWGAYK